MASKRCHYRTEKIRNNNCKTRKKGVGIFMTDRRRHPREMTVESLDRDIRLMKEMLEIREEHADYFWNSIEAFFNQQEIDRLRARILELVKMREALNEQNL